MTKTTPVTDRKIFGKLGSVSLHDIIQLLGMTKRTATVRLRSGALLGHLYFRDGQIVHASGGGFEGEDGVIELLCWKDPEFTIEDGIDSLPKITITQRTEALLLGTLTRLDETRRDDASTTETPPRKPVTPRRPPLPRRPTRRRGRSGRRMQRAFAGLAGLASLPILWLAIPSRMDPSVNWLYPWEELPTVDSQQPAAPSPFPLPDAWEVAAGVDNEPTVVPERRKPEAPVPLPNGFVTVVVEPWGRVAIDGVPKGETPLGRIELGAGSHELLLENDHVAGFIRDVIEVEPDQGIVKRYSFHDVGFLRVVVTPWADVSVDGRPIGQTPMGRIRVVSGSHSVRFSHPELAEVERRVEVTSGETTFVRIALTN